MRAKNKQGSVQNLLLAATLATAGLLVGCGGERSDAAGGVALKVNTPAEITNLSADNYNENVNGLITHVTLKKWIDDWKKNRPEGITGKLIIIQAGAGDSGSPSKAYIKADNKDVFTYAESGWREPRSNGVITVGSAAFTAGGGGIVLSGEKMDALIKKYGIDVNNDMIVCAAGGAATGNYMNQGRCWYTFSYWGVSQQNLAVLNGNNTYLADAAQLDTGYFTANPSPLRNVQVSSVRDLKVDNTALYASLEDMINVLPLTDDMNSEDGVFLWDARSLEQYSAGKAKWASGVLTVTDPGNAGGHTYGSFQNAAPRQSHPRGTAHLEWSNVLNITTGEYHSKSDLLKIVNGEPRLPSTPQFVIGGSTQNYAVVASGNAYQTGDTIYHFCETSARAGATLIAAAVILGIPSRLYDSGLIEWNSLTGDVYDRNGKQILPGNSPWNTRLLSAPDFLNEDKNRDPRSSEGWAHAYNTTVAQVESEPENFGLPMITNPYAKNAQKIPTEDRQYKQVKKSLDGGSASGGFVIPGNACGG